MTKVNAVLGALLVSLTVGAAQPAQARDGDLIGAIIGGGIGAIIGDEIGNGDSTTTIIGAVAGAVIGHEIGEDIDEADRRQAYYASDRAMRGPIGQPYAWRGSRSGYSGRIIVQRQYYTQYRNLCREYISETYTPRGTRVSRGVTCQDHRGAWTQYYQPTIVRNDYRRIDRHHNHYDRYDRHDRRDDRYDRRHRRSGR